MARTSARPASRFRLHRRNLLYLVVMAGVLYGLIPQLGTLQLQLPTSLGDIHGGWLLIACAALIGSFVAAAGVYYQLSGRRLPFGRTLVVQIAGLFMNRLLPAGSGALGVNYLYLRHQHLNRGRAIALVSANNILGFIGHLLLLCCLMVVAPHALDAWRLPAVNVTAVVLGAGVLILVVAAVLKVTTLRRRLQRIGRESLAAFRDLRARPVWLLGALLCSLSLTACYAVCLYAAAQALGVSLLPLEAFIVLTFSVVAATAVPVPGGLGAAEAGVVAGLVSFGVAAPSALAVALLYRFFTFWLALIVGAVAFGTVARQGYLNTTAD